MHPRTELVLGAGLVLALAIAAGMVGARRTGVTDSDVRRSTFLAGPSGARAYADALRRLGVRVQALRRPAATLDTLAAPRSLVAVIGPSRELSPREGMLLASGPWDLLIAGPGAGAVFRCLGYDVRPRGRESLKVVTPPGAETRPFPNARAVLTRRDSRVVVDSSDAMDGASVTCTAPAARTVDTLLHTADGRPVALVLGMDEGRRVTLVADDRLFSNRALRESGAGPFALGLVVPRYRQLTVDEYHHGFDASRSLSGAAWEWTLRSPWGWAVLQLAATGVVALLAAGVRFGPILSGIERRRRSSLEHVRALATALAAARGHDVAVGLMVRGLQRRLSRAGHAARGATGPWLESLAPALHTVEGRAALATLTSISHGRASEQDVLRAAQAVESLWEELTPA